MSCIIHKSLVIVNFQPMGATELLGVVTAYTRLTHDLIRIVASVRAKLEIVDILAASYRQCSNIAAANINLLKIFLTFHLISSP